ncbi:MAG: hypothetical protein FWG02_09690 [Holophagaceae bacterium]|nr:hypothetical protein [Holophagaceae bacterium]
MEVTSAGNQNPIVNPSQSTSASSTPKQTSSNIPPLEDILQLSAQAQAALDSAKSTSFLDKNSANSISPQSRAILAQLGKSVFSAGKDMNLGDALSAIAKHYDGIFSDMSEKTGGSKGYKNEWDELNSLINDYLKGHVDKLTQSGDKTTPSKEFDLNTALNKGQNITNTFLSAFNSNYSEKGLDAALTAGREAIANLTKQ